MADSSKIEWTEATWNPVVGCTHVSPGCDNCYAAREASGRLKRLPLYAGLAVNGKFTGEVRTVEERLSQPLRWTKPRKVFVNSDLFHDTVPDSFIAEVFAVMALTARHTFQLLTKRHARMRALLSSPDFLERVAVRASGRIGSTPSSLRRQLDLGGQRLAGDSGLGGGWTTTPTPAGTLWTPPWPLPNLWLGVSVENQRWAHLRVPALLRTPAAVRWLSCEPLLGPVDVRPFLPSLMRQERGVDWVVAGGESGPDARPSHPDWYRTLRDQCAAAGVPYFHKQWGEWAPHCPVYSDDEENFDRVLDLALEDHWVAIEPSGYIADSSAGHGHQPGTGSWYMVRAGKKAAGRQLDGQLHDEYPAVSRG